MSLSVTKKIDCAHSEDKYQHPPSLISVFNVHFKKLRHKVPITSSLDVKLWWWYIGHEADIKSV